jgi:hypothetical protein
MMGVETTYTLSFELELQDRSWISWAYPLGKYTIAGDVLGNTVILSPTIKDKSYVVEGQPNPQRLPDDIAALKWYIRVY